MPSKKKKYNARFPAGRIKKIMQTDEEVGKVAQAVPVIISRTLELFVESLLTKSMQITQSRNAKTLTPSHMKQCILSESRFDFLKDLVKNIPDPSAQEDNENNALEASENLNRQTLEERNLTVQNIQITEHKKPEIAANFYTEQSTSTSNRTPVIQYGPKVSQMEQPKLSFSVESLVNKQPAEPKLHIDLREPKLHIDLRTTASQLPVPQLVPSNNNIAAETPVPTNSNKLPTVSDNVPPLIPLSHNSTYGRNCGENTLYIDEDYDN